MFEYRSVRDSHELFSDSLSRSFRRPSRKSGLLPLALVLAAMAAPSALSATLDAGIVAGLKKLDLGERLEQRCDIEAMNRIDKDKKGFQPDRVVAAASAETKVVGNALQGNGAAVRSKGKWYRLSFVCKASADHMDVLSFDYKLGDTIPEADWETYGLFE